MCRAGSNSLRSWWETTARRPMDSRRFSSASALPTLWTSALRSSLFSADADAPEVGSEVLVMQGRRDLVDIVEQGRGFSSAGTGLLWKSYERRITEQAVAGRQSSRGSPRGPPFGPWSCPAFPETLLSGIRRRPGGWRVAD